MAASKNVMVAMIFGCAISVAGICYAEWTGDSSTGNNESSTTVVPFEEYRAIRSGDVLDFLQRKGVAGAEPLDFKEAIELASSVWEQRSYAICADQANLIETMRVYIDPELSMQGACAYVTQNKYDFDSSSIDIATMISGSGYARMFRIWRVNDGRFIVKAAHENLVEKTGKSPSVGTEVLSIEEAKRLAAEGMRLIMQNENIEKGWAMVVEAHRQYALDTSIRTVHVNMAFYVLNWIVENELIPSGVDVDVLYAVLIDYTSKGMIRDPFSYGQGEDRVFYINSDPQSIRISTVESIRRSVKYEGRRGPEGDIRFGLVDYGTQKVSLKQSLDAVKVRTGCLYIRYEADVEKAYDTLVAVVHQLQPSYPILFEQYEIPESIKEKYWIHESYLIAVSIAFRQYDQFFMSDTWQQAEDSVNKRSWQGNDFETMTALRSDARLIGSCLWSSSSLKDAENTIAVDRKDAKEYVNPEVQMLMQMMGQ